MKKTKGITLIALIITIMVMLILVAVSISIALNTGLFKSAGDATKNWKTAQEEEKDGKQLIGDKEYNLVEEYMNEINRKDITFYFGDTKYTAKERNNVYRVPNFNKYRKYRMG